MPRSKKKATRMTSRKSANQGLRDLWQKVPAALIPKPDPPGRLTPEETRLNYRFRDDDTDEGYDDPVELVQRVRMGVKPMGTVVLRLLRDNRVTERTLGGAVKAFGLKYLVFFVKGGRKEAVVFQKDATLAHYYDPDEVVARYKAAGVTLDRELFDTPLEVFARPLVGGDLPTETRLPITGLCLGYPIEKTLELLLRLKAPK
jgi:hypothetical protein